MSARSEKKGEGVGELKEWRGEGKERERKEGRVEGGPRRQGRERRVNGE